MGPPIWFTWQLLLLVYLVATERTVWAVLLALFLGSNLTIWWAGRRR